MTKVGAEPVILVITDGEPTAHLAADGFAGWVELRDHRPIVGTALVLLGLLLGVDRDEEVLLVDRRDVDRGHDPVVGDKEEAVLALQLGCDCLDQRIVRIGVLNLVTDRLDELEEVVGIHFLFADEEDIGEDVLVALVEFKEVHAGLGRNRDGMDPQYRTGLCTTAV